MKKNEFYLDKMSDVLSEYYADTVMRNLMEPNWFETINKYIYTDHYLFYLDVPYIDWHYCDDEYCDDKHFGGIKWYKKGFIKTKTTRKKNPYYRPNKVIKFSRYSDLSDQLKEGE